MLKKLLGWFVQDPISKALAAIPPSSICCWGESSKIGFRIGVHPLFPKELRWKKFYFQTAKFTPKHEAKKKLFGIALVMTLTTLFAFLISQHYQLLTDPSAAKVTGGIVFILGAVGLVECLIILSVFTIASMVVYRTTTSQWHGAEHKAIELIERGLLPSIENLRSMPKVTPRCGSAQANPLFQPLHAAIFLAMGLFLLMEFPIWTILPLILASILTVAAKNKFRTLAKWFQKFNTREPTYEQLQEAVEVVKNVYQTVRYIPQQ